MAKADGPVNTPIATMRFSFPVYSTFFYFTSCDALGHPLKHEKVQAHQALSLRF